MSLHRSNVCYCVVSMWLFLPNCRSKCCTSTVQHAAYRRLLELALPISVDLDYISQPCVGYVEQSVGLSLLSDKMVIDYQWNAWQIWLFFAHCTDPFLTDNSMQNLVLVELHQLRSKCERHDVGKNLNCSMMQTTVAAITDYGRYDSLKLACHRPVFHKHILVL